MIESTGRLIYDPTIANKTKTRTEPYWLILACDPEICRYYRYWTEKTFFLDLLRPAWGSHITVIRGEQPKYPGLWKKYANTEIKFQYSPFVETNQLHYWINIKSKALMDIREELGLSRRPIFANLHLTIGNRDLGLDDNVDLQAEYEKAEKQSLLLPVDSAEYIFLKHKMRKIKERQGRSDGEAKDLVEE